MNVIRLNTIGEVVAKRAPSGGGGSEGGDYLYVKNSKEQFLAFYAYLCKIEENEIGLPLGVYPINLLVEFGLTDKMTAVAIPLGLSTFEVDSFSTIVITEEYILSKFPSVQKITKEQFYAL